jgi:hypothetical protein
MIEKKTPAATDAERLTDWMEGLGGQIDLGAGKIKSLKLSKKGDRLTLVIKKKASEKKRQEQSAD